MEERLILIHETFSALFHHNTFFIDDRLKYLFLNLEFLMIALRNCFNLKGPPFPLHILFFPHLFLEEFERMIQFIITRQGHGKKYLVSFFFTIEVFELFRLYLTFLGGSI